MMEQKRKSSKIYSNVRSRVASKSTSNLNSKYVVTRHNTPTSARGGAKPNTNSSGFRDLPTVLNDFKPDINIESDKRRTFVVKPKKTIKSISPVVPPEALRKSRESRTKSSKISAYSSAPTVLNVVDWPARHLNLFSSRNSHKKLKELKVGIFVCAALFLSRHSFCRV